MSALVVRSSFVSCEAPQVRELVDREQRLTGGSVKLWSPTNTRVCNDFSGSQACLSN
jgi:hypothetical protein